MVLASMMRKWIIFLLIFLLTTKSEGQAGLLCISECTTCPVICSPPPSPSSPTTPMLMPPSSPPPHHHPPPQFEYISPPPSPTPHHPRPPPPSDSSSVGSTPPPPPPSDTSTPSPPSVYIYSPGISTIPPNTGQRNFTYPYYNFYTSEASCSIPLHQGFIIFMLFRFLQVFLGL